MTCGNLLTFPRASCDEMTDDEKRPYEFGFNIEGQQHRHEKKDASGIIKGEFGFITADGIYHVTVYATDENGNFKILSMKNIRVSDPLDGSAPYNPSLKGSIGSTQQSSRQPTGTLVGNQAPVTVVTRPPSVTQRVTPTVKVYTGCSGCNIPITDSPQVLGNYPGVQPQRPSYQSNLYTTDVSTFKKNEYSTFPRTNQPTRIPDLQVTNVRGITPSGISNENTPPTFFNEAQQSPGGVSVQPIYKHTAVTGIIKTTFPPLQPADEQYLRPSTAPPYTNAQLQTQNPSTFPHNQGQQPNPVLFPNELFPPEIVDQKTGQNFKGTTPNSVTVPNAFLNKFTKPNRDQISNSGVSPTVQQQRNPLSGTDKTAIGVEKDGLPPGITEEDIKALMYKFNYTVGFHGHYESGYRNGDKSGGYYFNGRDGYGRNVQYIANEFGYQPNISLVLLESNDTPKEETEKQFGLRGYEFKWFYRR